MIINLRYHIASLIAVFLALGIGIIIGSTVLGGTLNGVLAEQHDRMYTDLKNDLQVMESKNEEAQKQVEEYRQVLSIVGNFEKSILPQMVQGQLQNKKIAVIVVDSLNNNSKGTEGLFTDWKLAISSAGATICSETRILSQDILKADNPSLLATKLLLPNSTISTVLKGMAEEIGLTVVNGNSSENVDYLRDSGILKMSGDFTERPDCILFVTRSYKDDEKRYSNLDIPLMKVLQANDIKVLAAEDSDSGYSFIRDYKKSDIPAVAHIETVPGQIELIKTLSQLTK